MAIVTEQVPVDRSAAAGWLRTMLAAACAGAGVIHLAMVPSHAGGSMLEATGFAVFGWAQLALAVLLVVRPGRVVTVATAAVNVVALGLWAWSRSTGLPFGAHPGDVASITSVDATAAVLAAVATLGALVMFVFPHAGTRLASAGWAAGGAFSAAGLLATTLVLASPSARDHLASHEHADSPSTLEAMQSALGVADDGHPHAAQTPAAAETAAAPAAAAEGHPHDTAPVVPVVAAADRCDAGFNPAAYWEETATAGIDTVTGSHTLAAGHDHTAVAATIEGSPELDGLIALTTSADGAESKDAKVVAQLANVSDETYDEWLKWLPTYTAAHTTGVSVDDNGGHGGHLGPQPWIAMTDQAQCDQLEAELEQSLVVALKYPKASDAMAAGWFRVTGYVPGIAAHYMNFRLVDGTFDIDQPEMLLYDGDGPDASMVGLSYYLLHASDYEPTQGFTGPNDHFHRHVGLCVGVGGVIGDSSTTPEECAAKGGRKNSATGGWMNHVWIVPGCESPWGMFSGASPLLERGLAAVSGTDGGGCAGSTVRDRYDFERVTTAEVQAIQNG